MSINDNKQNECLSSSYIRFTLVSSFINSWLRFDCFECLITRRVTWHNLLHLFKYWENVKSEVLFIKYIVLSDIWMFNSYTFYSIPFIRNIISDLSSHIKITSTMLKVSNYIQTWDPKQKCGRFIQPKKTWKFLFEVQFVLQICVLKLILEYSR